MTMRMIFRISILLFLFSSPGSFAQCIADAGNDTIICESTSGFDTISLGGNPTAQNGTSPYTYTWSCDYWSGSLHFTASDFLNDTTVANPKIISGTPNYIKFFLEVKDSIGNICTDSISISTSRFAYSLQFYTMDIEQGDSIQFLGIPFITGGLGTLTFAWYPSVGLNDVNDLAAWASPDTTTCYSLTAIDSVGCKADTFCYYKVVVHPIGINETSNDGDNFIIYPNPASELITLKANSADKDNYELKIINTLGEIFRQHYIHKDESTVQISTQTLPGGIYLAVLSNKGAVRKNIRIIVQH